MAGAGIDVMHCTRDAEASLRRCVVGGMDDAHRQVRMMAAVGGAVSDTRS